MIQVDLGDGKPVELIVALSADGGTLENEYGAANRRARDGAGRGGAGRGGRTGA